MKCGNSAFEIEFGKQNVKMSEYAQTKLYKVEIVIRSKNEGIKQLLTKQ